MKSLLAALGVALALLASPGGAAAQALPTESVYHLDVPLTDQNGRVLRFPALAGEVRIVSMFYASCPYVCPLIIDTIKRTERALVEQDRRRLQVLLVSLDPERDTVPALRAVVDQRKLEATRWTLARTESDGVRKLAAVLGIQYRQLDSREFNHSSALILLDGRGRVLARSSLLGETDPEFVAAITAALRPRSATTGN